MYQITSPKKDDITVIVTCIKFHTRNSILINFPQYYLFLNKKKESNTINHIFFRNKTQT